MKYLNVLDENTEIKFDGSWLNGFINEMNSKEDLLNSLKAMPQNLRLNGKDWNGALIIHYWNLLNRGRCLSLITIHQFETNIFTKNYKIK